MGYGGRPMLTVQNNKNLIKERRKLFDHEIHVRNPRRTFESDNTGKVLYSSTALSKRSNLLKQFRKDRALSNTFFLVLFIILIAATIYIINSL